jgi:hypothetical protein
VTEFGDRGLREQFAAMRAADRARALRISETLNRPRSRNRVHRASRAVALVAGAAALVLTIGLLRRDGGRPITPPIAVSKWRPATDVLLQSARSPMLGPMPPLGASVLNQYLRTQSR